MCHADISNPDRNLNDFLTKNFHLQHNLHKHNLHVTHVLEPVLHTYHQTEHKVHPYVRDEHKVIPHHESVYKQHEHHVKNHPVVIEHKGWGQPAPQPGWGWEGAASSAPAEGGGYSHDHEGYRRSDTNVAEESAPVVAIVKPVEQTKAVPVPVVAIQPPAAVPAALI